MIKRIITSSLVFSLFFFMIMETAIMRRFLASALHQSSLYVRMALQTHTIQPNHYHHTSHYVLESLAKHALFFLKKNFLSFSTLHRESEFNRACHTVRFYRL